MEYLFVQNHSLFCTYKLELASNIGRVPMFFMKYKISIYVYIHGEAIGKILVLGLKNKLYSHECRGFMNWELVEFS